jgi:hypothetical protein
MAITGVLAFALSAWAVWLLSRTLDATRAAVKSADAAVDVTRELGEAQIRAYLYCKSARYKLSKSHMSAIMEIANAGQSPASGVSLFGTASAYVVGGPPRMPRVLAWVHTEESDIGCQPIAASGTTVEEFAFSLDYHFAPFFEPGDEEAQAATFKDCNEISFTITIKWSDVFGKGHELPVELSAVVDASPYSPQKKRSSSGKLDFRMSDARQRAIAEGGTEGQK